MLAKILGAATVGHKFQETREAHKDFHESFEVATAALPEDAQAQFASGLLYGASKGTVDERDYIVGCTHYCPWVSRQLRKAFEDYNAGDDKHGNRHMSRAEPWWRLSMIGCHETNHYFSDLAK